MQLRQTRRQLPPTEIGDDTIDDVLPADWPRGSDSALIATMPSIPVENEIRVGQRIGEFCVDGVLGRGGFGAVYKASHPVIGKVVAIKVLARQYSVDPTIMARFVDEARAVNQIRHRNIIDIFSFGQLADGRLYYVMEHLDGETLDQRLERRRMSLAEALPILRGIARALDAAHAAGITHRDLKAENVFIALTEDGAAFPKLFDFGIAKLVGRDETPRSKTRTGSPLGTAYYMSPEQTRGRNVDHRTDYYAFGVLAYRMLTGVFPLDDEDFIAILMKQVYETAPPASHHAPELSDTVDRTLAWLMQKDPALRPPNLRTAVRVLEGGRRADSDGFDLPSSQINLPRFERSPRATVFAPTSVGDYSAGVRAGGVGAIVIGVLLGCASITAIEHVTGGGETVVATEPAASLDDIWDAPTKRAVHAAFVATNKPYAEASYRSIERAFDNYAKQWLAMESEAGTGDAAGARRRECLQWRLDGLRARTELFAKADAAIVERAVDIAASLPELASCVHAAQRPIPDPVRAPNPVSAIVGGLHLRLATAQTLEGLAKYKDAITVVKPVAEQAVALGDRPLEAEAYYALGELEAASGEIDLAAQSLDRAIVAATAGRHDEVVARASIKLAYVVGVEKARYDEGHALMRHARAAIERLGGDRRLEAMLAVANGVLLRKQGHYDESLAETTRALVLGEAVLGPTHPLLGRWINSHGLTLVERGDYAAARIQLERARSIAERERGESHPHVGFGYGNLGLERYRSGHYQQAITLGTTAVAILERALGHDHPRLVSSLILVADSHIELREYDEAREHLERALAILGRAKQKTPTYASALASLGNVHLETGRAAKALPLLEQAVAILVAEKSHDPAFVSGARFLLVRTLHAVGNHRRVRELVPVVRAGFVTAGAKTVDDLAKLDAWIASISLRPTKLARRGRTTSR